MKNKHILLRKQVIAIYSTTIALTVLAFAFIGLWLILDNNGVESSTALAIGLAGFFAFIIAALSIMISYYGQLYEYNSHKEEGKMRQTPLTKSSCTLDLWNARRLFEQQGFTLMDNNVFHRRDLSAWRNYINYYVIQIKTDDVDESIETLIERTNDIITPKDSYPTTNNALLFVCYIDYPKEKDFLALKSLVINERLVEMIPNQQQSSIVPLIIDIDGNAFYACYNNKSLKMYDLALRNYLKMLDIDTKSSVY